jgi:protein-S-isoprenylcysteine O-methyltransferase Ste14
MAILFFSLGAIDVLSYYIFGYSTILTGLFAGLKNFPVFPVSLALGVISLALGLYLIKKSHELVFNENIRSSKVVDSGVYSLVRHPMYLGVLAACLSFFFFSLSLISLVVWIVFFIMYDRMATYEENKLVRKFGKKYTNYQNKVPKWFPKFWK